jgi:hypothetical protein
MEIAARQTIETIKLTMTILPVRIAVVATHPRDLAGNDPFASDHLTNLSLHHQEDEPKVSIDEVKYVGYMEVANKEIAILQLPNGTAHDVVLNEKFGNENAVVTQINETAVTFQVNGIEKIKPLA